MHTLSRYQMIVNGNQKDSGAMVMVSLDTVQCPRNLSCLLSARQTGQLGNGERRNIVFLLTRMGDFIKKMRDGEH
jgi:hypothetical protein